MKKLIIIALMCMLGLGANVYAADVNIDAQWALNGTGQDVKGFKFYLDDTVIHTTLGATTRTDSWVMSLDDGAHTFTMTVYGDGWESPRSTAYNFEYLYIPTDKETPPTMYIRIN